MRQLPLALGPEPDCTFDSFLPGANAAALQHLRTLGASAAPVYLWGASGCGKTHLLRALAARARRGWRRRQLRAGPAFAVVVRPGLVARHRRPLRRTGRGSAAGRLCPVRGCARRRRAVRCCRAPAAGGTQRRATTCARAWVGDTCSPSRRWAMWNSAPRCAAKPTGAPSSSATRSWTTC
ncbi:MAG: DnaA/Hda family protein [Rubrivivax sp.]